MSTAGRKRKALSSGGQEDIDLVVGSPAAVDSKKNGGSEEAALSTTIFPRDPLTPNDFDPEGNYLKIVSWNVAGLRGVLAKDPLILDKLVDKNQPDILCLQETKIQTDHIPTFDSLLRKQGYRSYWTCSETKKGYSGTVVFVKEKKSGGLSEPAAVTNNSSSTTSGKGKKQASIASFFGAGGGGGSNSKKAAAVPSSAALAEEKATSSESTVLSGGKIIVENVTYTLGDKRFDGEGRWIAVEMPNLIFINCYVPNSGMGLVRLDYRVKEWDPYVRNHLSELSKKKPVIFSGDLNVGHLDLDIYNHTAKHISKQAGLTPQERSSFTELLDTGFVDAFRHFHPDAKGHFSYWSQRTFARPKNNGIRLDYFVCSSDLIPDGNNGDDDKLKKGKGKGGASSSASSSSSAGATSAAAEAIGEGRPKLFDSYMLYDDTVGLSDHCPVVLVLKLDL